MSQFNKKIEEAQKRQRRFSFIAAGLGSILLTLVVVFFIISRGTRIEIFPEEAREGAEIRVSEGGLRMGDAVYSLKGTPLVTVTAPGYEVADAKITPQYLGKVLPVTLTELPGHLMIQLVNDENDMSLTKWRIGEHDAGRSSQLDTELKAGSYVVTADHPYYQIKEAKVELNRGGLTKLELSLNPVNGQLNIASKPTGAIVYVDGREAGKTPIKWSGDGGKYRLRLSSVNYRDSEEDVVITRDEPVVQRSYRLEQKKGLVIFNLTPTGGRLLVDGLLAENRIQFDSVVEHQVSYMKKGYYPQTKVVTVEADEAKEVFFKLKENIGEVQIESSPPATIWIGGKNYGISPVSVKLPAIEQTVSFKREGYRTIVKKVLPKGGVVKKISGKLLTEYQARLKEALPEYTAGPGIKMKFFMAQDDFIMGAPRSEKGQRANEIQRYIRLSKPFYASVYEITQGQFSKFMKSELLRDANAPVTSISWEEAAAFCNWLSGKEGLKPFYTIVESMVIQFDSTADGYRMLTEAEWEWLARKAGKPAQTVFSWGNDTIVPAKAANIADESAKGQVRYYVPDYNDGYPGEASVGSFEKEPSGLYDMSGNVSEWVHDAYSIVPAGAGKVEINPFGPVKGQSHVVKGANWSSGTVSNLRPAFREGLPAGRIDVGFRIARYLYGGENE